MKTLVRLNDWICSTLKVTVIALVACMLLALSAQVLMRYVFNIALSWTEELSLTLFTWSVLLAAALGVRDGAHVRLTLLLDRFPRRWRHWPERLIHAATLAFGAYLAYGGWDYFMGTRGMKSAAIAYPIELLYAVAPVFGVLIALFALEHALRGTVPDQEGELDV
jgi:TRAP-type C4-dicarboxylate transport system permease small subunit